MNETSGSEGAMRVDTDMVQTLAQLLSENDLTEIEVVDGDRRIAVRRNITLAAAPVPVAAAGPTPARPAPAPAAPAAPTAPVSAADHPGVVPSPMVGHRLSDARARQKEFRGARRPGGAGRDPADHRGDEGDEPDHRAPRGT
jgi:acetyl-CoA carboxylase biotin carboxyl carrier protein